MTDKGIYSKLSSLIGLGNSRLIPRIWETICSNEEARLLLALPGTLEAISTKTGLPGETLKAMLWELFVKGVVFEREKNGAVTFNPPRNFVQFHDATILWPDAPNEFFDLWKEYMDSEYGDFLNMVNGAGIGPFMRIIPVNKTVENRQEVLPYELVAAMVDEASSLAVTDCTCRKTQKGCDAPLQACIQLNRGADYALKRGTGRKISKQEALEILRISEEAGLIHLSENKSKTGNVICNCCPCCCQALNPLLFSGIKGLTAPSRFRASADISRCSACSLCLDRCHAGAISLSGAAVSISSDKCIGCGLCISSCPDNALSLIEIRPPSFIP